MISINATLVVQLINFLILLFILNRILFKPIMKTLEERDRIIAGSKEMAKELRDKGQKKLDEYNQILNQAKKKALQAQEELKREASSKAAEIIQSAKDQETKITDEIRREIAVELERARESLRSQAELISDNVITKILGRSIS